MKKTNTKAFTNLVASVILLVFEIWAYVQTLGFKVVKKAAVQPATFPQIMCIGMMVFTVILLVQSLLQLKKANPEDPMMEAAASINIVKNKGVQAGVFVIVLCIAYAALFEVLGYVLISTIVAAIIMWLIGKRDIKQIVLVSILVPLLMWFVFYKLLTVNIPMGVLQPLRNLVDMI
ncbi:MAG: tripartite tricarboxylate transporter TctB family protein [Clostridia bacterium]|nr:tripartite tricarboxylate transporter TctB family protein [Clostridia bacterium]